MHFKDLDAKQEQEFHKTAQRNMIGGFIGCNGPECWQKVREITADNAGRKIQAV